MPRFIWIVFVIAIFLRIIFLWVTPITQIPDEKYIFQRIWATKTGSTLSDPSVLEHGSIYYPNNEYYYPPLYFYLAAGFIDFLLLFNDTPSTYHQAYLTFYLPLRFLSLFLTSLGLFLIWKILDKFQLKEWIKTSAFILIAFIPTFVNFSSAINHNVLVFLPLNLAIFLLIKQKNILERYKDVVILGLIIGLALLAKFDSVVIAPFLILKVISVRNTPNFFKKVFVLALFILLGGGWWYLANLINYGWIFDEKLVKACLVGFIPPFKFSNYIAIIFINGLRTFFGTFGIYNGIYFSNLVYWIFGLFLFMALAGVIRGVVQILKNLKLKEIFFSNYFGLFLIFLANVLVFIHFNFFVAYQPQGRFLFPSLLFISLLLIWGISNLFPKKTFTFFPWILLFVMVFFNLWGLKCVMAILNSLSLPPEFLNCSMDTYIGKY